MASDPSTSTSWAPPSQDSTFGTTPAWQSSAEATTHAATTPTHVSNEVPAGYVAYSPDPPVFIAGTDGSLRPVQRKTRATVMLLLLPLALWLVEIVGFLLDSESEFWSEQSVLVALGIFGLYVAQFSALLIWTRAVASNARMMHPNIRARAWHIPVALILGFCAEVLLLTSGIAYVFVAVALNAFACVVWSSIWCSSTPNRMRQRSVPLTIWMIASVVTVLLQYAFFNDLGIGLILYGLAVGSTSLIGIASLALFVLHTGRRQMAFTGEA